MTTETSAISDVSSDSPQASAVVVPASRRLYWTVRRELWESRAIFLAPLAVGGLALAAVLVGALSLPDRIRAASAVDATELHRVISQPYLIVAGVMMLTTVAVGIFYCLDALYGERRDRSVSFWKSMPVSDRETVLCKVITPMLILPVVTFVIAAATQSLILLVSSVVLLASGQSAATLWAHGSLFQTWPALIYHLLTVHGLWYAPLYGWLLLASAWARRAPFLWAAVPLLAMVAFEKIAFDTSYFGAMLLSRIVGGPAGDDFMASSLSMDPLMHFRPGGFLVSPGVWIGLALTAVFLEAAVRLRRLR
jgi:ABC-2 type transport system permease protein